MKNKGFSILECIFSLLLLTTAVMGIMGIYFNIKNNSTKRLYEASLYTNYLTILRTCEVDPANAKELLVENFANKVILNDENHLQIKIDLVKPYKVNEYIIYDVVFEETTSLYKTKINVLNPDKNYEEINNDEFNTRVYKK